MGVFPLFEIENGIRDLKYGVGAYFLHSGQLRQIQRRNVPQGTHTMAQNIGNGLGMGMAR